MWLCRGVVDGAFTSVASLESSHDYFMCNKNQSICACWTNSAGIIAANGLATRLSVSTSTSAIVVEHASSGEYCGVYFKICDDSSHAFSPEIQMHFSR